MNLRSQKYTWRRWSALTAITDYIVLDVETTGFSSKTNQIIEVGMVKVSNGNVVDEYSSLVAHDDPLSPSIKRLTGLSDEDFLGAPAFGDIAADLVKFIGKSVVVGHNVTFDLGFIETALSACRLYTGFSYLDTLQLSRRMFPDLPNHKLDTLKISLSLYDGPSHRALDDAKCTQSLFQCICDLLKDTPYVDAIDACCTPIDNYAFTPLDKPLDGKTFSLVGTYTFPYSALRKLIPASGGKIAPVLNNDVDYLVCGYIDELSDPDNKYEVIMEKAERLKADGAKLQLINEVNLLKLCGVMFY